MAATLRFHALLPPAPSLAPCLRITGISRVNCVANYRQRQARQAVVSFALAESNSPESKSITGGGKEEDDEPLVPLLQELSDCLLLPPDFLARLPRDLRLDLNDAAFDLSNGPVLDECGPEIGELLLNLAKAWETADTATSNRLAKQLPTLEIFLAGSTKPAFGKRLVAAGRRFESMGQYGEGETQKIAQTMVKFGTLLSRRPVISSDDEVSRKKSKKLQFGEIEFEMTVEKANIGAAVALIFGVLSWQLKLGVESSPENSLQYANENALQLAKPLRGALLLLSYSSTFLSVFAAVGLLLLGRQIASESKSE